MATLFQRYRARREYQEIKRELSELGWTFSNFRGDPMPPVHKVTTERAMKIAIVYACVRIISTTAGQCPIHVFREDDRGFQARSRRDIENLLKEPNPLMLGVGFREFTVACMLLSAMPYTESSGTSTASLGAWKA